MPYTKKRSKGRVRERREEALQRQQERNNRSPQDQLNRLDDLLGKNVGAKKERNRLNEEISKKSETSKKEKRKKNKK